MASNSRNPKPRPAGSSVGARWTAGVGAFLLVAAAATFVAVRWAEIPDQAKFGALMVLTLACLGADRRLRASLPITATALFHIGILLVPIDMAAVGLWRAWAWPEMLLLQGATITAACGVAGFARDSVVLRVGAWLGVVGLASGVGASFGVPSGLVLALLAFTAACVPWVNVMDRSEGIAHRLPGAPATVELAAAGWATLAALAMPLAWTEELGLPAAGVLTDLGLADGPPHGQPVATGLLAGGALAIVTARRQTVGLAWLTALALSGSAAAGVDAPPAAPAAVGVGGALIMVTAALAVSASPRRPISATVASLLGGLSLGPLAAGAVILATQGEVATAIGGAILGLWLLAALLDHVPLTLPAAAGRRSLGTGIRTAALVPLAALILVPEAFTSREALVIASLFTLLALADTFRLREPMLSVGVGCAAPIGLVHLVLLADGSLAAAGTPVALLGLGWLAIAAATPESWSRPATVNGTLALTVGLVLSVEDPRAFDVNLILVGAVLLGSGVLRHRIDWVAVGGPIATLGLWRLLPAEGVTISEPYVAPVALSLLAAGIVARRRPAVPIASNEAFGPQRSIPMDDTLGGHASTRGDDPFGGHASTRSGDARGGRPATRTTSSWLAYAPAVAMLGGAGVAERLAGGPGWHALLAGVIGVVAVAAGAVGRLAGPLVTGTVLLVAVTIQETLGATAQVPTWAWLALGGLTLLVTGVAMERRGTGPLETGRRLVDLVDERFT